MFLRAAPEALVVYGTKAFPNVAVMRLLAEEGLGADVATLGELAFARRRGSKAPRLVVHGNNKSDEELRAAAEAGALVALDALDEPARAAAAGVRRVLVRVTPGVEAETHEAIRTGHRGSKFGLDADDALEAIAGARDAGLEVEGLHVHVGSQLANGRAHLRGGRAARRVRRPLPRRARLDARDRRRRRRLRRSATSRTSRSRRSRSSSRSIAAAVERRVGGARPPGAAARLRAGPGARRPGRVHALPRRRGQAGGRHALRRDRRRHVRQPAAAALRRALLRPAREPGRRGPRTADFTIAGKHCESGDVLIEQAALPEPRRGDLLAVPATGAYTLAMSSNYNGVPRPAAVLVSRRRRASDPPPRDGRRPAREGARVERASAVEIWSDYI